MCHANDDSDLVKLLDDVVLRPLYGKAVFSWYASHPGPGNGIEPDDDWMDGIVDRLRKSAAIIGMITPTAAQSHSVSSELFAAKALDIPRLTIRFRTEPSNLPVYMGRRQSVDGLDPEQLSGGLISLFDQIGVVSSHDDSTVLHCCKSFVRKAIKLLPDPNDPTSGNRAEIIDTATRDFANLLDKAFRMMQQNVDDREREPNAPEQIKQLFIGLGSTGAEVLRSSMMISLLTALQSVRDRLQLSWEVLGITRLGREEQNYPLMPAQTLGDVAMTGGSGCGKTAVTAMFLRASQRAKHSRKQDEVVKWTDLNSDTTSRVLQERLSLDDLTRCLLDRPREHVQILSRKASGSNIVIFLSNPRMLKDDWLIRRAKRVADSIAKAVCSKARSAVPTDGIAVGTYILGIGHRSPFKMLVEDVRVAEDGGTIVSGRVLRGVLRVGSEVVVFGENGRGKATAISIEMFDHMMDECYVGDNVDLVLGTSKNEIKCEIITKTQADGVKPNILVLMGVDDDWNVLKLPVRQESVNEEASAKTDPLKSTDPCVLQQLTESSVPDILDEESEEHRNEGDLEREGIEDVFTVIEEDQLNADNVYVVAVFEEDTKPQHGQQRLSSGLRERSRT